MYFAWKTTDVPEDFRDSDAVMYACFAHLQACASGGPMIALTGVASIDASMFAKFFLIWIFSVSSVVLVVCPKVYAALKIRRNPHLSRKRRRRVNVTGLFSDSSKDFNSSLSMSFGQLTKSGPAAPAPRRDTLFEAHEPEESSSLNGSSDDLAEKIAHTATRIRSKR